MVVPTATIMLAHGVSVRCMDAETGLRAKDAALRMLRAAIERNYCAYSDLGNDPSSETASARRNQVCQRLLLASVHQGGIELRLHISGMMARFSSLPFADAASTLSGRMQDAARKKKGTRLCALFLATFWFATNIGWPQSQLAGV